MILICRKCGIKFPEISSFQEVDQVQRMTCGAGGTHRLVGVNE